jgi:hypothetical protein
MSVTVTNLILGPGTLYQGAFGNTEPSDANVNVSPPNSGTWTDVGGTLNGITVSIDQTYTELQVDQLVDSVGRRLTKREFLVTTQMAEPTLNNLTLALNGSTSTSGTTSSSGTYSTVEPLFATSATQPTYAALLVDGYSPNSLRRRAIFRKCLSTAKVDTSMDKSKQTVFTVTFNGHYVSSSIAPIHVVDQTS